MIFRNSFFFLIYALSSLSLFGQELKVTLSSDNKKIDRNARNGVSTVIFDSRVKNLNIINQWDDELVKPSEHMFIYRIDTKKDLADGFELSQRVFLLNSPKSAEFVLDIDEIRPNQVLYYTVVLPDYYAWTMDLEYLFTKTAMHGFRLSFGKRFGVYFSYKWGDYKKAGTDIATVTEDYDVTRAKKLGYIRNAYTVGLRLGLVNKERLGLYLLLGGGYGDFGRQWQNPLEVNQNIYFYSDYIRGFNGDLALQVNLLKWFTFSVGADMLVGNGNLSMDYQIGLGVHMDMDKLFKRKRISRYEK